MVVEVVIFNHSWDTLSLEPRGFPDTPAVKRGKEEQMVTKFLALSNWKDEVSINWDEEVCVGIDLGINSRGLVLNMLHLWNSIHVEILSWLLDLGLEFRGVIQVEDANLESRLWDRMTSPLKFVKGEISKDRNSALSNLKGQGERNKQRRLRSHN